MKAMTKLMYVYSKLTRGIKTVINGNTANLTLKLLPRNLFPLLQCAFRSRVI